MQSFHDRLCKIEHVMKAASFPTPRRKRSRIIDELFLLIDELKLAEDSADEEFEHCTSTRLLPSFRKAHFSVERDVFFKMDENKKYDFKGAVNPIVFNGTRIDVKIRPSVIEIEGKNKRAVKIKITVYPFNENVDFEGFVEFVNTGCRRKRGTIQIMVCKEGKFEVVRGYRDLVNHGVVGKSRRQKSILNVNVGVSKCAVNSIDYASKKAELATRIAKIESYWQDELDALSQVGWEYLEHF